jgi:hypothetical protein
MSLGYFFSSIPSTLNYKQHHLIIYQVVLSVFKLNQITTVLYAGGTEEMIIIIMAFGVVSFLSSGTPIYQSVTV